MKKAVLFLMMICIWSCFTASAESYRALLVGEDYRGQGDRQLDSTLRDTEAMKGMLDSMTATPWQITKLLGPSRQEILKGIQSAFDGSIEEDVCLFFYMGHGVDLTGDLVCNDGRILELQELKESLDAYPCKKIVILASCYSGRFIPQSDALRKKQSSGKNDSQERVNLETINENIINTFRPRLLLRSSQNTQNRYNILTAAADGELAYTYNTGSTEVPGFSFFTYALTEGSGYNELKLESTEAMPADSDSDSFISLQEGYNYCSSRVNTLLKQYTPDQDLQQHIAVWPVNAGEQLWGRSAKKEDKVTPSPTIPENYSLPQTGDNSHMELYAVAFVFSLLVLLNSKKNSM